MGEPALMSFTVPVQFDDWPILTDEFWQVTETETSLFPDWSEDVAEADGWSASPL